MITLEEIALVYLLCIRSKDMSEFNDIIKRRKMVRQYIQTKPIPQQIVDKLITNAHRAPSQVILRFKNL